MLIFCKKCIKNRVLVLVHGIIYRVCPFFICEFTFILFPRFFLSVLLLHVVYRLNLFPIFLNFSLFRTFSVYIRARCTYLDSFQIFPCVYVCVCVFSLSRLAYYCISMTVKKCWCICYGISSFCVHVLLCNTRTELWYGNGTVCTKRLVQL